MHKISLFGLHFISEAYFMEQIVKIQHSCGKLSKIPTKVFQAKNNPRTNQNERYFYNLFWPACCAIRSLGDVWLSEIVEWSTSGYQILGSLKETIQILGNPYCELVKRRLIGETTKAHKQRRICKCFKCEGKNRHCNMLQLLILTDGHWTGKSRSVCLCKT